MTAYRKTPQRRRPLLLAESSNSSAVVIGPMGVEAVV